MSAAAAEAVCRALRQADIGATTGRSVYAHKVVVRGTLEPKQRKLVRQLAEAAAAPEEVSYNQALATYLTITCGSPEPAARGKADAAD